jgi:predicted  nucleic acid-binding Zn-ribbon protein
MLEALKIILDIQEFDMKMIRLMRLKSERKKELDGIYSLRKELGDQLVAKDEEIKKIKASIRIGEGEVTEVEARIKNLEAQQSNVKKLDEFNALSQQLNTTEKERAIAEQKLNSLGDQLVQEESILDNLKETLKSSEESSQRLEEEILRSIEEINTEGKVQQGQRDALVASADPDVFKVYERLLLNRKDRVVVPIEDRSCSGCHIMLTAQHENLVRKGERLVFCEHCSRIHYWQDSEAVEGTVVATKRRRRRQQQPA